MDINYIFGVTSKLKQTMDTVERGFILDTPQGNIPTGTPCLLFSSTTYPTPKKVLLPFPNSRKNTRPRLLINQTKDSKVVTKNMGVSNWLDTIKTVEIPKIPIKDIPNTIDRVQNVGPVTFLINANNDLKIDLLKMLNFLSKKFKISSLLDFKKFKKHNLYENEQLLLAVTLADIKCCIPIFNPIKANGVLLYITTYYPIRTKKHDQLINSFEISILFSKYTENLVEIDGTCLNFSIDSIDLIRNTITECTSYINDIGNIKEKSKRISKSTDIFTTMNTSTCTFSTNNSASYIDNF